MRPPSQAVENKHVESGQQRSARRRNTVRVGAIGHFAYAESEDTEPSVAQSDRLNARPQRIEGRRVDPAQVEPGDAARRPISSDGIEGVVDHVPNAALGLPVAIDGQIVPQVFREDPQIVQSEHVIGMLMRESNSIDPADSFTN